MRVSDDVFDYCECRECGLLFLHNVPRDLASFYPADYYGLPTTIGELARIAQGERFKIDLVRQFKSGGRLVEIGPGSGGFAFLAKEAGFDVTAIEMNDRVCTFLRSVVGVSAVHSTDELASLREVLPADAIALWQVLEHLTRPWELIRVAAERLLPGGILVLAAPNPQSAQRKLLGRRWVHLDAPRHVALMPTDLVTKVGRDAGLEVVSCTTRDVGSRGWNTFGWRFLAKNLAGKTLEKVPLVAKSGQAAGILFARAIAYWEDREGVGTAYTIVLRKPT